MSRPLEVVRLRIRHAPPPAGTAPLPEPMRAALSAIAGDLRHLPRDCIVDRAELILWLRRLAGRVEGVAALRITTGPPRVQAHRMAPPPALSARQEAEAVFGKGSDVVRLPGPRTIVGRTGRAVRVEMRRGRAEGQMDLGL